jgi:iron(III) transport system permease protein
MFLRKNKFSLAIVIGGGILIFSPILFLFIDLILNGSVDRISEVLSTTREWHLLIRSLTIALGTALLSITWAIPLAFLIHKTDLPLKRVFGKLYLIPFFIPPYLQAILWIVRFQPGFLQSQQSGLDIFTNWGAIFVYSCSLFPLATLIISSGFRSIDSSLEEAALIQESPFSVFCKVTFPLAYPHIMISFFLVYILSLTNFEVADTLRLAVYPLEIFINFSAFYDDQKATLLALPLIGSTLIILVLISHYMRGKSFSMLELSGKSSYIYSLNRFKYLVTSLVIIFFIVIVGIPLFTLFSGVSEPATYLKYFLKTKAIFGRTVIISFAAAFTTTFFSYAFARILVRSKGKFIFFLDLLTLVPLGIPSVLFGISLIKLWNRPFMDYVYSSPAILIIGSLATLSPFIIRVIYPTIHRIDSSLEEAAQFTKQNSISMWLKVYFPLSIPGLMMGIIISFVLYIGNIGVTLLITPPGEGTIPITIYNYMHYGSQEAVFALSAILMLIIFIALLPLIFLKRKFEF